MGPCPLTHIPRTPEVLRHTRHIGHTSTNRRCDGALSAQERKEGCTEVGQKQSDADAHAAHSQQVESDYRAKKSEDRHDQANARNHGDSQYRATKRSNFHSKVPGNKKRVITDTATEVPVRPDDGIVVVRFFIRGETQGPFKGDGRTRTSEPSASNRVTFAFDTQTGQLATTLSESCVPAAHACKNAHPIDINPDGRKKVSDLLTGHANTNRVGVKRSGSSLDLHYSLINSFSPNVVPCCHIDGKIKLERKKNGDYAATFNGDKYSSLEIYQYRAGRETRTIGGFDEGDLGRSHPFANDYEARYGYDN